jgi:adenylosuccinate lyase
VIERYSRPEMARVWSAEHKIDLWLRVEVAVCEAWAAHGEIPMEALPEIRRARVDVQRMAEIERETEHDVIAFLRALAESIGPESRFVHLGLTSSDVVDTALALQIVEALDLLERDVDSLEGALTELALAHRDTIMIGRTHGIHAEPTTFGLKVAVWVDEARRARRRLHFVREELAVGKLAGAVGTHANVPPAVEEDACRRLGLAPVAAGTQVIQRDRHATFMAMLGVIAASLEKIATEVRHLQRTEVREVEEPFQAGQQGSSAMPHKRNPIKSERVCGLARLVRGYVTPALENVALWHERDISHSSAERVILPDACLALDYALDLFTGVLRGLRVDAGRMRANVDLTGGLIFSQQVLLALVEAGMDRQDAYKVVQDAAMRAWTEGSSFQALLASHPHVTAALAPGQLDRLFDLSYHLQHVDTAYKRLGLPGGESG